MCLRFEPSSQMLWNIRTCRRQQAGKWRDFHVLHHCYLSTIFHNLWQPWMLVGSSWQLVVLRTSRCGLDFLHVCLRIHVSSVVCVGQAWQLTGTLSPRYKHTGGCFLSWWAFLLVVGATISCLPSARAVFALANWWWVWSEVLWWNSCDGGRKNRVFVVEVVRDVAGPAGVVCGILGGDPAKVVRKLMEVVDSDVGSWVAIYFKVTFLDTCIFSYTIKWMGM